MPLASCPRPCLGSCSAPPLPEDPPLQGGSRARRVGVVVREGAEHGTPMKRVRERALANGTPALRQTAGKIRHPPRRVPLRPRLLLLHPLPLRGREVQVLPIPPPQMPQLLVDHTPGGLHPQGVGVEVHVPPRRDPHLPPLGEPVHIRPQVEELPLIAARRWSGWRTPWRVRGG